MKLPQRATKILKILKDVQDVMDYYTADHNLYAADFRHIREYIEEISKSKKLSEIKIATKIKKEQGE